MNTVNLVATLATQPAETTVAGDKIVSAEVYLRPGPDEAPPPVPDRVRVVAHSGTQAAVRLVEAKPGQLMSLTGSLRRVRAIASAGDLEVVLAFAEVLTRPATSPK